MKNHIWSPGRRGYFSQAIDLARRTTIALAILSSSGSITSFGTPLKIEDAIEMAYDNAELSNLETLQNKINDSRRNIAKSLPDPTVFWEQEKLRGNHVNDAKETRLGVSTSISFLWTRGSRIAVEDRRALVVREQQNSHRKTIRRMVSDLYRDYQFELNHLEIIRSGLAMFQDARKHAVVMLQSGALAVNDLSKIDLLISQIEMEQSQVEVKMLGVLNELSVLLGVAHVELQEVHLEVAGFPFSDAESAMEFAYEQRSDWREWVAKSALLQSIKKEKSRSSLPEASLDMGAIQNDEGQDGGFVGLSVDIPIFSKKKEIVSIAESEVGISDIEIRLLKRRIETEVRSVFREWESLLALQKQLDETSNANLEKKLVDSSLERFKAGEYSLLEHIDSIKSYIDTLSSRHQQELLLWHTAVKLSESTGADLPLQSK